MVPRRAARHVSFFVSAWLLAGCTRASVASLLPTLELGINAQQRRSGSAAEPEQRWAAVAFVGLSFRSFTVAAAVPSRAELAPESWIAPCDEDDVICLQEATGAEQELAQALGELQ